MKTSRNYSSCRGYTKIPLGLERDLYKKRWRYDGGTPSLPLRDEYISIIYSNNIHLGYCLRLEIVETWNLWPAHMIYSQASPIMAIHSVLFSLYTKSLRYSNCAWCEALWWNRCQQDLWASMLPQCSLIKNNSLIPSKSDSNRLSKLFQFESWLLLDPMFTFNLWPGLCFYPLCPCMTTWQQNDWLTSLKATKNVKIVCRNGHSSRRKPWRETFHMQHPLQPKNIAGLYGTQTTNLPPLCSIPFKRAEGETRWSGVMNYHCDNRYAIWIWDTQNDALEKRRLLANVAGYKKARHCTAGKRCSRAAYIPAAEVLVLTK